MAYLDAEGLGRDSTRYAVGPFEGALSRRETQSVSALKTLNILSELRLQFPINHCVLLSSEMGMASTTSITASSCIDASRFCAIVIDASKNSLHHVSDVLFMEKCLLNNLAVAKGRIQRLTATPLFFLVSILFAHLSLHRARHTSMEPNPRHPVFEEQ